MSRLVVALSLAAVLVVACSPSNPELAAAESLWESQRQPHYVLEFFVECNGDCDLRESRHELVFRDGEFVTGRTVNEEATTASPLREDDLDRVPSNVVRVFALAAEMDEVAYDERTGIPTMVVEGSVSFSGITVRFDVEEAELALAAARQRWQAAGLSDYTLSYQRNCSCLDRGEYVVDVVGGEGSIVESPIPHGSDDLPLWIPTTVEGMFDLIGDTLARPADQFSFAYSEDGSPSALRFDYKWRTADDEFSYLDVNVFTN